MNILITGAGGFIGSALCNELSAQGMKVKALARRHVRLAEDVEVIIGDLEDTFALSDLLAGIDVVVHLAGRAHQLNESLLNPLELYRKVNRDLTVALAESAVQAGVKRFVFISSIGVNGLDTTIEPVNELSVPNPVRDYAISKFEAEQRLSYLLEGKMELVIVRPPLVYAANAPGNFRRLLRLVKLGVPLPFAKVTAKRSMISLANLLSFLNVAINHPSAANQLFLVSDGDDIALPEILECLASGMQRNIFLVPVPLQMLRFGMALMRKEMLYKQLCGCFLIDSSKARTLLDWKAPFSAKHELLLAARQFMISSGAETGMGKGSYK